MRTLFFGNSLIALHSFSFAQKINDRSSLLSVRSIYKSDVPSSEKLVYPCVRGVRVVQKNLRHRFFSKKDDNFRKINAARITTRPINRSDSPEIHRLIFERDALIEKRECWAGNLKSVKTFLLVLVNVPEPNRKVLGLPDPFVRGTDPDFADSDPLSIKLNSMKPRDFYCVVTSL